MEHMEFIRMIQGAGIEVNTSHLLEIAEKAVSLAASRISVEMKQSREKLSYLVGQGLWNPAEANRIKAVYDYIYSLLGNPPGSAWRQIMEAREIYRTKQLPGWYYLTSTGIKEKQRYPYR